MGGPRRLAPFGQPVGVGVGAKNDRPGGRKDARRIGGRLWREGGAFDNRPANHADGKDIAPAFGGRARSTGGQDRSPDPRGGGRRGPFAFCSI